MRWRFRPIHHHFPTHPRTDRMDPEIANAHIGNGDADRHLERILQGGGERGTSGPVFP